MMSLEKRKNQTSTQEARPEARAVKSLEANTAHSTQANTQANSYLENLKITKIVLASASPRRKEILNNLKLNFDIMAADIDESVQEGESPMNLVERLSASKAQHIAQQLSQDPHYNDTLIIAADTVVALEGKILNKPTGLAQNYSFIVGLNGKSHNVYTGHTLYFRGKSRVSHVASEVYFRQLDDSEIAWYVATGEGLDKAGGYAIQGYGASLVKSIKGCYFNVVGLSLAHLIEEAKHLGVRLV